MPAQLLALVCVLIACTASADEAPLFLDHGTLQVVLTAPLSQVHDQRNDEQREYLQSTWSYIAADGAEVTLPVGVRARGNFRRIECDTVPLRLNFKKSQLADTLFDGQNKLKLVRPCERSKTHEQYVVQEYLVYRAFALLSDYHFRVRPLLVTYRDSDGKRNEKTRFSFVIEDRDEMAARMGLAVVEQASIDINMHEPWQIGVFELFNFMVSGHDWSAVRAEEGKNCCHNSVPIAKNGLMKNVIMVPYDFDFSGAVDAKYAAPPAHLKIDSVRKRRFKGRCESPEQWQKLFDHFRSQRAAILALYDDNPHISNRGRAKTQRYLNEFFSMLDNPKRVEREILNRCFTL